MEIIYRRILDISKMIVMKFKKINSKIFKEEKLKGNKQLRFNNKNRIKKSKLFKLLKNG
jgi:hypothetical protein